MSARQAKTRKQMVTEKRWALLRIKQIVRRKGNLVRVIGKEWIPKYIGDYGMTREEFIREYYFAAPRNSKRVVRVTLTYTRPTQEGTR